MRLHTPGVRMKIRDSAVLLLSLGLAFAPLRVSAPPPPRRPTGDEKAANLKRAEELYRNGERLYTEGSYESAILAFQESYELSKEPQLLYNIGNAYERLGDFANSRRYLDQYRAFAPGEGARGALATDPGARPAPAGEGAEGARRGRCQRQEQPKAARGRRPRRSPDAGQSQPTTSPRRRRTASTGPRPSP
jgi:tetratricopeptide (TPR) repeat protein